MTLTEESAMWGVHLLFIIVYFFCLIFGFVGFLVAIPLHIVIALLVGNNKRADKQTELLKEQNKILQQKLEENEKTD